MNENRLGRREFLLKSGSVALATAALPNLLVGQPERPRTNVVLILADDLGYECLGANGGTSYRTPVLDGLARRGVRFDHCYSQPLCTPSRVQLMTGLSNKRNYVRFGVLARKERTFGHIFKEAGYATGVFGKWQLGSEADSPRHFGFDESCLFHHTRKAERYHNPGLDINGGPVDYVNGEYGPAITGDLACEFMERHRNVPFFLYYPMSLTHDPFQPTPDSADWPKAEPQSHPASSGTKPAAKSKPASDAKYFADMVAYMDNLVGQIMEKIESLGIAYRTLVLFTGDNGTHKDVVSMLNGSEYRGGKRLTIDAGTHVPLIAVWPGTGAEGVMCDDLVDFCDFLPTICEAAGIELPADAPLDGVSFLPQIKGQTGTPKEAIFSWYLNQAQDPADAAEFARDKRFKLYKSGGQKQLKASESSDHLRGDGDLFDVVKDPFETSPLPEELDDQETKAARARLRRVIERYSDVKVVAVKARAKEME